MQDIEYLNGMYFMDVKGDYKRYKVIEILPMKRAGYYKLVYCPVSDSGLLDKNKLYSKSVSQFLNGVFEYVDVSDQY